MAIDKLLKDDKSIKDMYVLYHFSGEFLLMLFEQIIFFKLTILRKNTNLSKFINSNITRYIFLKIMDQILS